jgi:hypothetical protein
VETVNTKRRLAPSIISADETRIEAIRNLANYQPANASYSRVNLDALDAETIAAQKAEQAAKAAWESARDIMVMKERERHEASLGATDQVAAQYGRNSNEYQSLGLRKKNEARR